MTTRTTFPDVPESQLDVFCPTCQRISDDTTVYWDGESASGECSGCGQPVYVVGGDDDRAELTAERRDEERAARWAHMHGERL